VIHGHNLPPTLQMPDTRDTPECGSYQIRMELLERDLISDALKSCQGSIAAAAEQLGITPRMVRYKLKRLGLDQKQFSAKAK
jgi:Nif-specific regulatory protein